MIVEKVGDANGARVVVPDDIKTDEQAQEFMRALLPDDTGVWCIARTREYYMSLGNKIVEDVATRYGFDNAISARSYAAVENQYQAFSVAFIKWSVDFWVKAENLVATMATISLTDEALLEELPKFSDYASNDVLESVQPAVKAR